MDNDGDDEVDLKKDENGLTWLCRLYSQMDDDWADRMTGVFKNVPTPDALSNDDTTTRPSDPSAPPSE